MTEKLLNIKELCLLLNISEHTARHFVFSKKIPFTKVGKRIRFQKSVIEKWLKDNTSEVSHVR
jgi:excisionase family DNA binding protein